MKRTLTTLFLLVALLVLVGALGTRPVLANPDPPPIMPFAGTFVDHGDTIAVAGFVHLNVLSPDGPPIRIYANLLDTQAVNGNTGETFVGTGTWLFEGAGPLPNTYAFTAFFRLNPNPPPIRLTPNPPPILPLSFVVGVNGDGSISDASVFVGGPHG